MLKKSAGFAIVWNGKLLLSHPTGAPWYHTYSIIKGGVEDGEDLLTAACREFAEETGTKGAEAFLREKVGQRGPDFIVQNKEKALSGWIIDVSDEGTLGLFSKLGLNADLAKNTNIYLKYPKEQLQHEEIDWAGLVDLKEAEKRIAPYQMPILEKIINARKSLAPMISIPRIPEEGISGKLIPKLLQSDPIYSDFKTPEVRLRERKQVQPTPTMEATTSETAIVTPATTVTNTDGTAPASTDLSKISADNEKHIRYLPISDVCNYSLNTVLPKSMAQSTYNALLDIKKILSEKYAGLDEYVQEKLAYTPEEMGIDRKYYLGLKPEEQKKLINSKLCLFFANEQLDSIAEAIFNIEYKRKGMIIGDQAGIGKGRVAGAIIRYCIKAGKMPIFITEKSYLFSDIFRDLIDIGSDPNIPQQKKVGEHLVEVKLSKAGIAAAIRERVDNGDDEDEATEMVMATVSRGFELKAEYRTNKEYDEQVKKAKRQNRLQIVPFIPNNRGQATNVKNLTGDILYYAQNNSESGFKTILNQGKVPKGFNCVMSTYTQFSSINRSAKMEWLAKVAQGNVIIMDESHNASGESNTGRFLQEVLANAAGATFLSATFAKRPDNMVVYAAKTSMQDAGLNAEEMVAAIKAGGVPLQEIIATQLVGEGEMIRRERTYKGINVFYYILNESMAALGHPEMDLSVKHRAIYDVFISIFNDIIDLQSNYIAKWAKERDTVNKYQGELYGELGTPKGYTVEKMVTSSPLFSRVFNTVNQLLFSLKAEAIADRAIHYLQNGKKPVIAFANTMEAFMDYMTNEEGGPLREGDLVDTDFKVVLNKLLENTLMLAVKSPKGDQSEKIRIEFDDMPYEIQNFYRSIVAKIKTITVGITVSPIDVLLAKITEAGFIVEEVTGRANKFVFTDDAYLTAKYTKRNKPTVTDAFRAFNQNKTDALLINQSASTGGSLHAAPNEIVNKVCVKADDGGAPIIMPYHRDMIGEIVAPTTLEDRDVIAQRVMIVLQPELDINKEVQKRGRVFRSGQVLNPIYEYLSSDIPAEKRLQMMLQKKLHSLDANVSSNQKTSDNIINIVDFLNKYGDEIVVKYLMEPEHQPLIHKLGDPLKMLQDKGGKKAVVEPENKTDAAHRVSGRIAILAVADQEAFYTEISDRYVDYIKRLDATDENDLEVKYLDLEATTQEREIFIVGAGTNSLFGRNAIIEKCEINNLRKPYTQEELQLLINEALQDYQQFPNPAKRMQVMLLDRQAAYQKMRLENADADWKEREEKALLDIVAGPKFKTLMSKNKQAAEDYQRTLSAKVREDIELKKEIENITLTSRYETVRNYLKRFYVGMVSYYTKGEANKVRCVVVDIEIDMTRYNPWTPGNIRIKLAFANGIKVMSVPLTANEFIDSIIANQELSDADAENTIKHWERLTKESIDDRVVRYIITGNILKAMSQQEVFEYGSLVKFTTSDKKLRNGILMSETYNPAKGGDKRGGASVLVPASKCMPILDLMEYKRQTRYIDSNNVQISKDDNDLDFIVTIEDNSREMKWFSTDPDVLALVLEEKGFQSSGMINIYDKKENQMVGKRAMIATVERDKMQEFLDLLSKKFSSNFRISKGVFDQTKALLGIDIRVDYKDGSEIDESESGLSSIKIDINNPLYQKAVEEQDDPVSESEVIEREQEVIDITEKPTPPPLAPIEHVEMIAQVNLDRVHIAFEHKLLKLYRMLMPALPPDFDPETYISSEEAQKALDDMRAGHQNFLKHLAKGGPAGEGKQYFYKDKSGRGAKGSFDEAHIRAHWDLEDTDWNSGDTLEEFLDKSEPGDEWVNATIKLTDITDANKKEKGGKLESGPWRMGDSWYRINSHGDLMGADNIEGENIPDEYEAEHARSAEFTESIEKLTGKKHGIDWQYINEKKEKGGKINWGGGEHFGKDPRLDAITEEDLDDYERFKYQRRPYVHDKVKQQQHDREALQLLINDVEGDYSQLSPKLAEIARAQDAENGDIISRLEKLKLKGIESLLNKLSTADNLDKRMEICDEIISILERNNVDIVDYEDDVKDLAINFARGGKLATGKKYDTEEKKIKAVKKKGNIITFKEKFYPRGTADQGFKQIAVTGFITVRREGADKGAVKIEGRAYDSNWYDSMDKLLAAVDWDWMERAHADGGNVGEPTEAEMRETYFKAFGKQFDSEDRKQHPLPIKMAYEVALRKLASDSGTKPYKIVFEDVFSGATETKNANFTDSQYEAAKRQRDAGTIVVDKLINAIHWQFKIRSIAPVIIYDVNNEYGDEKKAEGGKAGSKLKKGDAVINAVGTKLLVDDVKNGEYWLRAPLDFAAQPWGIEKVDGYLASGEWTKDENKMAPEYIQKRGRVNRVGVATGGTIHLEEAKRTGDVVSPVSTVYKPYKHVEKVGDFIYGSDERLGGTVALWNAILGAWQNVPDDTFVDGKFSVKEAERANAILLSQGHMASGGVASPVGHINYTFKVPTAQIKTSKQQVIDNLKGTVGGNQGDLKNNKIEFKGYESLDPGDEYYSVFSGSGVLDTGVSRHPSPQQKSSILHEILSDVLQNNHGVRAVYVTYKTTGGREWETHDMYAEGGAFTYTGNPGDEVIIVPKTIGKKRSCYIVNAKTYEKVSKPFESASPWQEALDYIAEKGLVLVGTWPSELKKAEGGQVEAGWKKLFAHPERFMRYDGQFLYPPRVEHKIQPASLEKLDNGQYLGELKYNGSSTSVSISENKVVAKERHGTIFAIPPKFDFQSMHRGTGYMCFAGEYMNKSKKGPDGKPFKGFIIWDIMAFEGEILIGSTVEERKALIDYLYPTTGALTAGSYDIAHKTATMDVYKVVGFESGFRAIFKELTKVEMIEGFVLKRKNWRLETMNKIANNIAGALKARKATSNYRFKEGGQP